ncbi:MAG: CinA family protein [Dehalococcoidia bacterium]|nr:CinA family protein [Dehalococcoidia bacterium]
MATFTREKSTVFMADMFILVLQIANILRSKRLTFGVAESATGGLISHIITNVPDVSDVYKGSVTAYANQTKMSVLGVKQDTLQRYGAVSSQAAEEMALGCCNALDVDISVSDTGIAGPGGAVAGKPVGLFYVGLAHRLTSSSRKHVFHGDREENKKRAAYEVLKWLKTYLEDLE